MSKRSFLPPIDHLAIVAGTLLLTLFLVASDWLQRWDNLIYDAQLTLMSRPAAVDTVIVAIDDASLNALGRWPWTRDIHGNLVERLSKAGAKAIFLDILFSEETPGQPQQDQRLVEAVRESGRVFLPVVVEERGLGGQLVETLPFTDLAAVARGLGHAHMELETDGIVRGVYLKEGVGSPYWEQITISLLRWLEPAVVEKLPGQRNPNPNDLSPFHVVRDHYILIPYSGPPGHVPRLSYAQVLQGQFSEEDVRGRIVLVGATATGLGDLLPTPLSGRYRPMSGVEINAQLLDGLRRGLTITRLDRRWLMFGSAILVLIPFLLFPRLSPRAVLAAALGLLLGTLLLSGLLLFQQLWFPPISALVGIMLSYPLWSWRRLENTMGYLNGELENLQAEPRLVGYFGQSPELGEGLEFLSQILPIDGWRIEESDGAMVSQQGAEPRPPETPLSSWVWTAEGGSLWAQVTTTNSLLLGLEWGGENNPTINEWEILNNFLAQLRVSFVSESDRARNTRELIERRIQQVKSASDQLCNIRRLINDTLGQMEEGLVVTSAIGLVIMVNPRAAKFLAGDESGDLRGRPLLPLLSQLQIHSDDSWTKILRAVLVKGDSVQLEASCTTGMTLYIQLDPLALHDQTGRGMIINFSDVTLLKRSERQRSQALGFLSHDLRSPITSLLALLDSGKRPMDRAGLMEIETYARKTLNLADDFLNLARAENADADNFSDIDLISVAHNAVDEIYSRARAKQIIIQRKFEPEEVWLCADAGLLERAFINLLGNAVKFSPQETSVTFRIGRTQDGLQCEVLDQGPGISIEEYESIFTPYIQGNRTMANKRAGTGLGLAQVKAVVEKHGGDIQVRNGPEGGAWFTLTIPLGGTDLYPDSER
ncbi:MAG: CHASE2 domain-containing protein [Sedimenticola sp.]